MAVDSNLKMKWWQSRGVIDVEPTDTGIRVVESDGTPKEFVGLEWGWEQVRLYGGRTSEHGGRSNVGATPLDDEGHSIKDRELGGMNLNFHEDRVIQAIRLRQLRRIYQIVRAESFVIGHKVPGPISRFEWWFVSFYAFSLIVVAWLLVADKLISKPQPDWFDALGVAIGLLLLVAAVLAMIIPVFYKRYGWGGLVSATATQEGLVARFRDTTSRTVPWGDLTDIRWSTSGRKGRATLDFGGAWSVVIPFDARMRYLLELIAEQRLGKVMPRDNKAGLRRAKILTVVITVVCFSLYAALFWVKTQPQLAPYFSPLLDRLQPMPRTAMLLLFVPFCGWFLWMGQSALDDWLRDIARMEQRERLAET